jgi:ABC-type glycerol-3-phosphate transport system substrate-binding protein
MPARICFILSMILLLLSGSVLAQETGEQNTSVPETTTLTIWWPDEIALHEDTKLNPILMEQSDAFLANESNVVLEHRLKPIGTIGGIMSTLRTASNVAPGALPSLTLVRRRDLLTAERAGFIQSLEGNVASSIQGELDTALALAQVDGVLYGVPYLLELQHLIYHPQNGVDYSSWAYDNFLKRETAFAFAAGRAGGLSDVFLLQYLNSGGQLNPDGTLALNETALRTTLEFYEAASDATLIDGFVLNYTSSKDYLSDFLDGNLNVAVFDSTTYLLQHEDNRHLQIAPIPTESGTASTILDGWVWVMLAIKGEEQAAAIRYLDWMMNTKRQSEFSQAVYRVPSRRSALDLGLAGGAAIEPYLTMLENPILPISESDAGSLGRSMQVALSSVLTLEQTAEEATAYVIEQQPQD